jgi:hypothetical protein
MRVCTVRFHYRSIIWFTFIILKTKFSLDGSVLLLAGNKSIYPDSILSPALICKCMHAYKCWDKLIVKITKSRQKIVTFYFEGVDVITN